MAKQIIGIHGLAPKPPASEIERDWLKSINDGLERRQDSISIPSERFSLAYWAIHRYEKALVDNPEPYTSRVTDSQKDDKYKLVDVAKQFVVNGLGKLWDAKYEYLGEGHLRKMLKEMAMEKIVPDLANYYDAQSKVEYGPKKHEPTRTTLRNELKELLDRYQQDDILLISHSMGSIIAYDVLCDLSPDKYSIPHFVTIGSPLGFAEVKLRIKTERNEAELQVPEVVSKSWSNYADPNDFVALDASVADDYKNPRNIHLTDVKVHNGYRVRSKKEEWKDNPHKSYGYLRTEELAKQIVTFW